MPPQTPLSAPLRSWRCPQCTATSGVRSRPFTVTTRSHAVGPEHPRYIDVPQPPQQTVPDRRFIKGRLPVPRDVFSGGKGQDKASEAWLHDHTQPPKKHGQGTSGSGTREAWKGRMSDMRRRNLREGLVSLRARKDQEERLRNERSAQRQAEREELLKRPEREDERLTTPSSGLDLEALKHMTPTPEERAARISFKEANLAAHTAAKRAERMDHLHTLYLNARTFIVTPQQLEKAVDDAFGFTESPVSFEDYEFAQGSSSQQAQSVWAQGRPETVQDMLNRANRQGSRNALEGAGGFASVNRDRIRRIGEVLTGAKM
ncbi:hypothetical protein B0A50_07329 [Salinomyces thailandicus]|uniref:Uncharacterized protein n=1 Tax=Salinomyces thailandicus TaxID=706561 RepID=A0A4U0TNC2_9PEZI|nr:hypothetical protein B0A50_07329 [Salinomyces thailandica]